MICPENRGKAAALNAGIAKATGELILFTDARQQMEPRAVRELVSNFADPEVGCVSGELMFIGKGGQESGVSIYWRLEKVIRKLESATGSVVGATGSIYAVRRTLIPGLPRERCWMTFTSRACGPAKIPGCVRDRRREHGTRNPKRGSRSFAER